METIPGTDIQITHRKLKWFDVTPKKLLTYRKYFLVLTVLFIITAIVELYIAGEFNTSILLDLVLGSVMYSFSIKCETQYLKMKIENTIDQMVN